MKKILVPGGTGAMGVYLVPELLGLGYKVDVVSLDECESDNPDLRYFKGNFKDPAYRDEILKNDYDAIVDFMIYSTEEFKAVYETLLSSTGHYIYLSSYRVYANEEHPIRETSPRLYDVYKEGKFAESEDYSLYKARGEEVLKASAFTNWTGIRPAITFSKRRFQLVTLEANTIIPRAKRGVPIPVPKQALGVQATMSWAGDVAKMISRLVLNDAAKREIYTVATAEHNTWETVMGYYKELVGLKPVIVDKEEYIDLLSCGKMSDTTRWQLEYDRLFDRIVDNTKILTVTGMKQSELTTVYDGLKREISALPDGAIIPWAPVNAYMDEYFKKKGLM